MPNAVSSKSLLAALLALGALAAAGCGRRHRRHERGRAGDRVEPVDVLGRGTSANCPSDVEKEKGKTFTCTVKLSNGATGDVTVTQEGGNRYTYAFKPGTVKIPGETVEAEIKEQLAAEGAPNATVTCPETITVKVGTTVTCDVSGAQGAATGTVTFTFSSDDGEVDPDSVETSE